MKNKKILITGGAGFIGNHLAYHLSQQGAEVTILDIHANKRGYHALSNAIIIHGDMLDRALLKEQLQQVDVCFHLAAISSTEQCTGDPMHSHNNNVLAFIGLLEEIYALKRPVKLVYASSSAVYGNSQELPLKETSKTNPLSIYGADKLSLELYSNVFHQTLNTHSMGLRLFNVYGPGQGLDNPFSGVISLFKNNLLDNQPLTIFGDGQQTRDFIYVEDVVNAFITAAKTPQETHGVWNICTNHPVSILEVADQLLEVSNKQLPIQFSAKRPADIKHSNGDGAKARLELGFEPKISLARGLEQYWNC